MWSANRAVAVLTVPTTLPMCPCTTCDKVKHTPQLPDGGWAMVCMQRDEAHLAAAAAAAQYLQQAVTEDYQQSGESTGGLSPCHS